MIMAAGFVKIKINLMIDCFEPRHLGVKPCSSGGNNRRSYRRFTIFSWRYIYHLQRLISGYIEQLSLVGILIDACLLILLAIKSYKKK